jgi:DNA topoisomerase-1
MKNLIIVESPTKAKTIKRFLGKDYKVLSSFGHIRDLPKSELGIDEKKDFSPKYIIPTKARKTVSTLKKEAKNTDIIILASDEDREGEAIAWHIVKALNLESKKQIKRIVFHEITKPAILKALKNPREINMKLVNAQQARRVLDRLVGYKLSPFLWKKIARGLSAGRVQSVAVRLICEREKEINAFNKEEYWNIAAELLKIKNKNLINQNLGGRVKNEKIKIKEDKFNADLIKIEDKTIKRLGIKTKKDADKIKKDLEKANYSILDIQKKLVKKNPLPPYRTSTLQQDSAIRLRFSSKKTMFLSQKLYEGVKLEKGGSIGLITYMRTDSLNLAESFLDECQSYLKENFNSNYTAGPRRFKTKSKGAQEAHEAIRPTSIYRAPALIKKYLEKDMFRLYELIWQRAIASQMAPSQIENTKIIVKAVNQKTYQLKATGEIEKFDGFLKIYPVKSKKYRLPDLSKNNVINLIKIISEQKFTQPPKRYTEAMLIKILEKYGIGRPSTYAPTISTIQIRGYVKKNEERRFEPSEVGMMVNDLLVKYFTDIVDYDFTAEMEQNLDDIAEGKKEWQPIVRDFYEPFSKILKETYKRVKDKDKKIKKTGKKCPKCGGELVEKFSRYGRFVACSNYPECRYSESIDGKTNNEPKYSKEKCPQCGGRLVYKKGRYGEFLGCENYPKCKYIKSSAQKLNISCPKCTDGELIQKRTRKGRIFYACDKYPTCKFALWNKPIKEKCPKCGALLVQDKKGKIFCSNVSKKLCDYRKK